MSDYDPRLVRLYDGDNPDGPDHDFFRELVSASKARKVVDLGCGTGILTVTLVGEGREVVGIDPSATMLDYAAGRPGGELVSWVRGTAKQIAPRSADVVIMSGNVSMHILGDEWPDALGRIATGLRPGGVLAFESRNPEAEAWRGWNDPGSERHTSDGLLRESCETEPPDGDGCVAMHITHEFVEGAERLHFHQRLQFRSHARILADLAAVGLTDVVTYRNWNRDPFTGGPEQPLMVFVAQMG